jgi:hypothetical protein
VVAADVGGHVHVDNVAVLQLALVGDAVADDLGRGSTGVCGQFSWVWEYEVLGVGGRWSDAM